MAKAPIDLSLVQRMQMHALLPDRIQGRVSDQWIVHSQHLLREAAALIAAHSRGHVWVDDVAASASQGERVLSSQAAAQAVGTSALEPLPDAAILKPPSRGVDGGASGDAPEESKPATPEGLSSPTIAAPSDADPHG